MHVKTKDDVRTYLEWVLAGYAVPGHAKCVGQAPDGEPLYSYEDVEKEDRDL